MSILLFSKIATVLSLAAGTIGAVVYAVNPNLFSFLNTKDKELDLSENTFVLVAPKESSSVLTASEAINSAIKNFNCHINNDKSASFIDSNCQVEQLSIKAENTKKHIFLSNLHSMNKTEITKESLANKNTLYKVKVTKKFLNWINKNNSKEFDLVSKEEKTNKYVTFKILLSVDGSKYYGQTSFSVAKSLEIIKNDGNKHTDNSALEITPNITTYNCNFLEEKSGVNNVQNACSIHEFSSTENVNNDLSTLTFSNKADSITSIKKDNFYLFKFTDASKSLKEISLFKKDNSSDVQAIVTSPSDSSIKTIVVSELTPSILINTGSDSADYLLLLIK